MGVILAKKKTILLLGASSDQLYAIRTAQAMGLNTLVVDANPNAVGFSISDDYAVVSTRDVESLKQMVDQYHSNGYQIAGVLVQGSDIPHIVCSLAEYIDTPHIPMQAALLSTHKLKMKQHFYKSGVAIPWFSSVKTPDHLRMVIKERGYPLIIKPVDRSGSRGVYYLDGTRNIDELFADAQALSLCGDVLVEEFLDGLQISTETIMYRGKAYTPGFVDRNYDMLSKYLPNIIENGGTEPSSVTYEQRLSIESLVEKAAISLGVTDGVVKGDIVLSPDGPKIIEVATRLSGGDFSESLIPLGIGVNIVEAALNIAMGNEVALDKLKPRWSRVVLNRYFFPEPGTLKSIDGLEEVSAQPWVQKLETWYNIDEYVPEVKSHADRFGVFIVTGETLEEANQRADWVYQKVKIVTCQD